VPLLALNFSTYLDTVMTPLATMYLDNATEPKIQYMNVEGFTYNSMYDSKSSLLDYLRGDDPVYPAGRFYDDADTYVGDFGRIEVCQVGLRVQPLLPAELL